MQPLFGSDQREVEQSRETSAASWSTKVLGFIGSAIICWIVLRVLAPFIVTAWGFTWITNTWVKIGITGIVALATATLLPRIEGTIWGMYYVIIGYFLSLALVIWIVLRLLYYI